MGIYDELSKLDEKPSTPKASEATKGQGDNATFKKSKKPSNHDIKQSSNQAVKKERQLDSIVEHIRKALKRFGKEQTTHRLTVQEKKALLDIVYAYKSKGIKTNENEIARIAVNFIVMDYKENGKNSILEKAIRALSA